MKLNSKYPQFFSKLTVYFSTLIRFILNILLIIISLALVIGVIKSGFDLYDAIGEPLETVLQNMLLDTIFIVALVEISLTILGYLKDGSVHVRYIVDTMLIIMLNEVVGAWFHGADFMELAGLSLTIATLAAVRITTIKYSSQNSLN